MTENSTQSTVLVVGGGASGMMAAGQAALQGKHVLLIEKNKELGEKLKITGGARCNITNAEYDTRVLLKHYGKAEGFLYSPFSKFGVKNTFDFFESLKLPLVVEARKRAFPFTQQASDVFRVLKLWLQKNRVKFQTGCMVERIIAENGKIACIQTSKGMFYATSFILATGGVSHPETGSTGDGFKFLKNLGHTVQDPTPTIVPLAAKEEWIKTLSGVSLSFMKIHFFLDGKHQFSKIGKVLFTHFGLSGPLILNISSKVAELLKAGLVTAQIDPFPDTDLGTLDRRVIKIFNENKNKMLKNVLPSIVPIGTEKGIATFLSDSELNTGAHSITQETRKKLVHLLKALPVTITGLMGFDRAVVADGGVDLKEIDMKTMRSKLYENLYVVGDLLNINRPSGGYSLQLCWTTGFVAGISA